jgi:4-alpha-glucanotransferase
MPFSDYDSALNRALELCGVQAEYWDIFGKQRFASQETKRAILSALGMNCSNREALDASVDNWLLASVGRILPPCAVVGQSGVILLHVPAENRCDRLKVHLDWEDGSTTHTEIPLGDLHRTDEIHAGNRCRVRIEVPVTTLCAGEWRLGYHRVSAGFCGENCRMWLIATPERAWLPPALEAGAKSAGLGVQLYGVRSARNWGCGDFSDLPAVASWAAALGASFIALNPLHAIHNRRPYNTSPYLPFSLLYRNFLYLDVERLPEFQQCPWATRTFATSAVQSLLAELRASDFVEYERVAAIKMRFLRRAFVHGRRHGTIDVAALRRWIESEGEGLQRFATYCALDEFLHRRNPDLWIFPDWPAEYQHPDSPTVSEFRKRHARNIEFYCYLQWRIDQQATEAQQDVRAAGMSIGLYHDLPLATDRYGCELWGHREFYVNGCRVGSPPDDFSPSGQDWGFPPPDREQHRVSGYRHYVDTIRAAVRHGGALRIDHVMRLFRLYWIPDKMDASCGAYVGDNWEDLIRILALESVRNEFFVVGEDLGTVEPWVRDALARFRILSYRLLYFERGEWGRFKQPDEYPRQALVSTTTHDLATLAGFWAGADIEARREAGVLDDAGYHSSRAARDEDKRKLLEALRARQLLPEGDFWNWSDQVRDACLAYLAESPAMLIAINHEDLSAEPYQQNLPGTTAQYPNWARKMRQTATEMVHAPATAAARQLLERAGRTSGVR